MVAFTITPSRAAARLNSGVSPHMKYFRSFYSVELGAAYAAALPALQEKLSCIDFACRSSDFGIAGNTFRAYRGWGIRPSIVYREWAASVCSSLDPDSLATQICSEHGFQSWHLILSESLQNYWVTRQGKPLSFAHQHKLVDLFVKWLSSHDFETPKFSNALVANANCALDSQTLCKLNECLSYALPMSSPRMGDIRSETTYTFCQNVISDFARTHGGTRLLFDYFAWRSGGGG